MNVASICASGHTGHARQQHLGCNSVRHRRTADSTVAPHPSSLALTFMATLALRTGGVGQGGYQASHHWQRGATFRRANHSIFQLGQPLIQMTAAASPVLGAAAGREADAGLQGGKWWMLRGPNTIQTTACSSLLCWGRACSTIQPSGVHSNSGAVGHFQPPCCTPYSPSSHTPCQCTRLLGHHALGGHPQHGVAGLLHLLVQLLACGVVGGGKEETRHDQ